MSEWGRRGLRGRGGGGAGFRKCVGGQGTDRTMSIEGGGGLKEEDSFNRRRDCKIFQFFLFAFFLRVCIPLHANEI